MKEQIWNNIEKLRETSPLIHNITNYVVMNNTANALLATGASPVMAHAVEEVEDMVSIAGALVINIGTLSEKWVDAMKLALKKANELNKPVVLDPVGVGATPYRNNTASELLQTGKFDVIRGNASEIMALSNTQHKTKGVDSTDTSDAALTEAVYLNKEFGSTICISGKTDYVVNDKQVIKIYNGHSLMAKITGMGCIATALIGAFLAVEDDSLFAAAGAMGFMGTAGELAVKNSNGPASLQVNFIDKLHNITKDEFINTIKIETSENV